MQKQQLFVTFVILEIEQKYPENQQQISFTKFSQIVTKLSKQLSQYTEIDQQVFIKDLNTNTSDDKNELVEKLNIWKFIWSPKNAQIQQFLQKHQYIGTKVFRMFFNVDSYTKNNLTFENMQKLPINNVQRINYDQKQGGLGNSSWKKGQNPGGDMQLHRNYSGSQKQQYQQQKRLPETLEEYQASIEEMQQKIKSLKQTNKELKDSNYMLDDTLDTLVSKTTKQQDLLDKIQEMMGEPIQEIRKISQKDQLNESEQSKKDEDIDKQDDEQQQQQQQEQPEQKQE